MFIQISAYFMNNRADIIQELVRTRVIRSQEELIGLLAEKGILTTQATLSRDLKKLRISKQHDKDGVYCYVLPESAQPQRGILLPESRAGECIVSLEISGQMGVVKTLPGCANMVGALIDEHRLPGLMGTVAGEDTLLLILRENAPQTELLLHLERLIPGIGKRLIEK